VQIHFKHLIPFIREFCEKRAPPHTPQKNPGREISSGFSVSRGAWTGKEESQEMAEVSVGAAISCVRVLGLDRPFMSLMGKEVQYRSASSTLAHSYVPLNSCVSSLSNQVFEIKPGCAMINGMGIKESLLFTVAENLEKRNVTVRIAIGALVCCPGGSNTTFRNTTKSPFPLAFSFICPFGK
jgi:hypothetical protein